MSYDEITFAIIRGENLRNLPLKVTYYCRVSTDSDVQLNSLENQLDYYRNYIKSNVNWTFVEGYYDEGVTGVVINKRSDFKRMISDAKLNKFNLIVTKEVSRFARDLEDSIHTIRELRDYGVGLFFENQALNTFDPNSEMTLNTLFSVAQEESKKLSARVKFGHKRAMEKGHVLGSSNITGYVKKNCKLVIVPEEAKFVRLMFELYSTGEYGFYSLSKELEKRGYLNKNGRMYDKDSLKRMITNPKYKGFYRSHAYEIMDYRTKRRKSIPIEEQTIYKVDEEIIPGIVSEELWDKANDILKTRTGSYKANNHWSGGLKYPFSSKIYCKEHNTNFQRSHGSRRKNRPTWSCGMYLQYRLCACASPIIAEIDLYNILKQIMDNIIPNKSIIVDNMVKLYRDIDKYNRYNKYNKDLETINKSIKDIEDKKNFAFEMVFNGELTRDSLKTQFDIFDKKLHILLNRKREVLKQIDIFKQNTSSIDVMSRIIREEIDEGLIEEFVRTFVDEIIVSKIDNDRHNLQLDIFLNLVGTERKHTKGAKHIKGPLENETIYLGNQKCNTIESKREKDTPNRFTYNVYIETL